MASARTPGRDGQRRRPVTRRSVLGGIGSIGSALVLGSARPAAAQTGDGDDEEFAVEQGDRCVSITPLSGDEPVEALYGLRIPDQYGGDNGASDPGSGPYFESTGTTDLQRPNTTITFLYDGPDGLSLVVVHGHARRGSGGSVTWQLEGLPSDGGWVVRDDYYLDPQTGNVDRTSFDRWRLGGSDDVIDWTWTGGRTDGGAFRSLGSDFEVTVTPAYNEAAALWEQHFSGHVTDWQLLSGDRSAPERTSLALGDPVTLRTGGCDEDGEG